MKKKYIYLAAIGLVFFISIRLLFLFFQNENIYQMVLYILLLGLILFLFFINNQTKLLKIYAGILVLELVLYFVFPELINPLIAAFPKELLGWNILLFLMIAARNIGILALRPIIIILFIIITVWIGYRGYTLLETNPKIFKAVDNSTGIEVTDTLWNKAPFIKKNGKNILSATKNNGITLVGGHYRIEILSGRVEWSYENSAKTWTEVKKNQELKLKTKAYFYAKYGTAEFRVKKSIK